MKNKILLSITLTAFGLLFIAKGSIYVSYKEYDRENECSWSNLMLQGK